VLRTSVPGHEIETMHHNPSCSPSPIDVHPWRFPSQKLFGHYTTNKTTLLFLHGIISL